MVRAALLALMIFGAASDALAQQTAPALEAMRAEFASAVAKRDAKAASAFVDFPLANRVYREPKTLDAAGFGKRLKWYAQMAGCLKSGAIVRADEPNSLGSHLVDCNGNLFYFVERNGKWRYAGYENINE